MLRLVKTALKRSYFNSQFYRRPRRIQRRRTPMHEACIIDRAIAEILADERYRDERRLQRFGFKAYSQNDEDGIIQEILKRIGAKSNTFVEIGIEDGLECNTLYLLIQGWKGIWVEGWWKMYEMAKASVAPYFPNKLALGEHFVTPDNCNEILQSLMDCHGLRDIDLLSIDIDSVDYWVWRNIECIRPRIVVIEYNALWRPPLSVTLPEKGGPRPNGNYVGASLVALEKLGEMKGYRLVGCSLAGVNCFFVREDLVGDEFHAPYTAENHYEPPRLYVANASSMAVPGIGPLARV